MSYKWVKRQLTFRVDVILAPDVNRGFRRVESLLAPSESQTWPLERCLPPPRVATIFSGQTWPACGKTTLVVVVAFEHYAKSGTSTVIIEGARTGQVQFLFSTIT